MNVLMFSCLVLFWGLSFIAIHESIKTFPPFMAAGIRIFLAMVLMLIYALVRKRRNPIKSKLILAQLGLGILMFGIPWGCLFWGEQFVHPSIAAIINSTVPIFVLLFSWLMLPDEKPVLPGIIGVLLGFVGILFVFLPSIQNHSGQANELSGIISILIMAVSYGLGAILLKKVPKGTDMVWGFIFQALSGSFFLAILSFAKGETVVDMTFIRSSSIGLVYLAVCSSAIASLMYYHLISEWGVLKAAAVTYLTPFVALAIDMIFLKVHPKKNEFIGGTLIMIGILLIHWARTKNFHKSVWSVVRRKKSAKSATR